jgi:FAD/FMN-containing dehydrogenase
MPMQGGIVLDMAAMNAVLDTGNGWVRTQAGAVLKDIDAAARAAHGQELRFHPSTWRTATIGGFVAGGSGGVGSITWGSLRSPGSVLAARLVTAEPEPRVLELEGAAVRPVIHAYGTNGILTEVTMPTAPAWRWVETIAGFTGPDGFEAALRCGNALAHEDGIAKKLVTVIAAPVPHQHLVPELAGPAVSVVLAMVADTGRAAWLALLAAHGGAVLHEAVVDALPPGRPPAFELTWNHTTLQALKHDRTVTYLQVFYPPPDHVDHALRLWQELGDEVPMHVEFLRSNGQVAAAGLPLVRFTTEARLQAIIDHHNATGCPIANPHVVTLEAQGRKKVDAAILALKRAHDPTGILNPGKMASTEEVVQTVDHAFMVTA